MRLFWTLITLGITLWLSYQLLWTYYEAVLRRDVPDIFTGDIILFLHIVPLMAALALRPHIPQDEYAARLGRLDFALLLIWWAYLYVLNVIPWQYVMTDSAAYAKNLNAIYLAEKIAFLAALLASWIGATGHWKRFYANLLGVGISYAAGSYIANMAIARKIYYSGSLYDIPLVMSMAWLTWVGLRADVETPSQDSREVSTAYGVWVARCGMIAVFSLPLFAVWAMWEGGVPNNIRIFRVAVTLEAAFFMGLMILLRQRLLDRELVHLLDHSREAFDNLKHLQAKILQSEKLASIGQLVGGAAHELNNPITAMLGYSDLLLNTNLTPDQKATATKIAQHVRRTRSLVASLISFARHGSIPKSALDLNTLVRTAVKLTQPQSEALAIEVRTAFESSLPKVMGDSNQLLQVFVQLLANSLHGLSHHGGTLLTVNTHMATTPTVQIVAGPAPSPLAANANETSVEDDLGLAACEGIVIEHQGQILREHLDDGATLVRVQLPMTEVAALPVKESGAAPWQSRPYA